MGISRFLNYIRYYKPFFDIAIPCKKSGANPAFLFSMFCYQNEKVTPSFACAESFPVSNVWITLGVITTRSDT